VFREFGVPDLQSTPDLDIDWNYSLDGMAFFRHVRQSPNTPNPFIPIIVVTANTEIKHVCEARDTGMTEFLAKPVSARILYKRIVSILEHHRTFIRAYQFFGPNRRRQRPKFMLAD
jgi:two-component system chemotaxis response regulator CheY